LKRAARQRNEQRSEMVCTVYNARL
jgi:hypothetical protein